jgi:ribosomal protein S21
LKEYKKRTFFTKPSIEKRMEKIKAKRRAYKENMRARR